jgi:sugar lactone lactonase YvrE
MALPVYQKLIFCVSAITAGWMGGLIHLCLARTSVTSQNYPAQGYPLEEVASFEKPMAPSGIAVSRSGRIFLSFPRHSVDHPGPVLGELKNGKVVPFPSQAMNPDDPQGDLSQVLVSVHGITMDARDRLWVIDDGKRAGKMTLPGAVKVIGFDLNSGKIIGKVVFSSPALLPDSHFNDLRVDLTHGKAGTVLISDSSFGKSPALVVADLESGRAARRLVGHPSTSPLDGFMAVIEGHPYAYDPQQKPHFPRGGIDGVALSPDSQRLWFAPLTSRRLFSAPTSALADWNLSEKSLASMVVDEGEAGVTDSLTTDGEGHVYTTNHEQNAIFKRSGPHRFELIAKDERLLWPDSVAIGPSQCLYVTAHQSQRLPEFNDGIDLRLWPTRVFRICPRILRPSS